MPWEINLQHSHWGVRHSPKKDTLTIRGQNSKQERIESEEISCWDSEACIPSINLGQVEVSGKREILSILGQKVDFTFYQDLISPDYQIFCLKWRVFLFETTSNSNKGVVALFQWAPCIPMSANLSRTLPSSMKRISHKKSSPYKCTLLEFS